MSKSQMKLALRAWRKNTKELCWDKATPKHSNPGLRKGLQQPFGSKKEWKKFCREMAETSVYVNSTYHGLNDYENQADADESVGEELSYWDE